MTMHDALIRALEAGDLESALAYWRSKHWTDSERIRTERLLKTATTMRQVVLG